MKKDLTELVFIVDKSGSMSGLEADTVGGLNATLEQHATAEGDAVVSIVLFDNDSEVLVDRKPIGEVAKLTREQYQPGGCTALLDAVGESIRFTAKIQSYLPEELRPAHTMYVIITDGEENASKRWGYAQVKELIEEKRAGGWEFLFLGANIDAAAEAARMGIAEDRASRYVSDSTGSAVAYKVLSNASLSLRACGALPKNWSAEAEADARARG